jgi:hypothetical protein
VISKDNDTRFCAEGVHHFVPFNDKDAPGWSGARGSLFTKSTVLRKQYFVVGVERLDTNLLFPKTLKPHVSFGMICVKSGEKGTRAFA